MESHTTTELTDTRKTIATFYVTEAQGQYQGRKFKAIASKALTETKSRYANIEQKLLAMVYGCERLHTYPYGRSFFR